MSELRLSDADRAHLKALGISEGQVQDQLQVFAAGSCFLDLTRPARVGDGILRIAAERVPHYLEKHDEAARKGRFQKFVPASGAATRMFQSLLQIYYVPQYLECDELYLRVEQGVAIACDFLRFVDSMRCFPFLQDLEYCISRDGRSLRQLLNQGRFHLLLDYVLTGRGLNYGALPKGLIKFHRYPSECRTAFEEHLVESILYARNGSATCSLHFTVSPEHDAPFMALLDDLRPRHSERYHVEYHVGFSHQSKSTDTIAVDMDNRPFRDLQGRLHFRPGGHGALLANLDSLQGDIVFIKNIDNVVQDRLKDETARWKKILAGFLVELQETAHDLIRRLQADGSEARLREAEEYARHRLLIDFPTGYSQWNGERRLALLLARLNRPIRVCGVVPNEGEPGGAPFWISDSGGTLSLQIVEKAQVDMKRPDQQSIWSASSHFNPVDLVCGLRDHEGKPFPLQKHVDPGAVFISKKSKDGRDLKALELPGLWNGAMADWITVFVEVPRITFNPVKTVFDLLRPEHLDEPCD
jgi:hypothetical protein